MEYGWLVGTETLVADCDGLLSHDHSHADVALAAERYRTEFVAAAMKRAVENFTSKGVPFNQLDELMKTSKGNFERSGFQTMSAEEWRAAFERPRTALRSGNASASTRLLPPLSVSELSRIAIEKAVGVDWGLQERLLEHFALRKAHHESEEARVSKQKQPKTSMPRGATAATSGPSFYNNPADGLSRVQKPQVKKSPAKKRKNTQSPEKQKKTKTKQTSKEKYVGTCQPKLDGGPACFLARFRKVKSPIIDPRPDGDCLFHCASIAINENTSTELVKGLRKGVVEEFLKLSEADQLRIARGELQELTTDLNQWSSAARKAVLEKYLVHGDNEMDEQHMEYLPENYLSVYRYVTDYADCDVVAIRKAMDKPDVAPDHDLNALAESMSETPEWQRALREDGMQRAQCGECPRCERKASDCSADLKMKAATSAYWEWTASGPLRNQCGRFALLPPSSFATRAARVTAQEKLQTQVVLPRYQAYLKDWTDWKNNVVHAAIPHSFWCVSLTCSCEETFPKK